MEVSGVLTSGITVQGSPQREHSGDSFCPKKDMGMGGCFRTGYVRVLFKVKIRGPTPKPWKLTSDNIRVLSGAWGTETHG